MLEKSVTQESIGTDDSRNIDFSGTNVQVEGVDEPDTVKTDGQYIYIAQCSNVYVVKAYPWSDAKVLSRINLNGTVEGIFIYGNRLVVFEVPSIYL